MIDLSLGLRLKIALGIATGLAYLHTQRPQVVFKECKAANILLDFVCASDMLFFMTSSSSHLSNNYCFIQG